MTKNTTAAAQIIPFDFRGESVRAIPINGDPWFVAADVCAILGQTNTTKALQSLDEDERSNFKLGRQGEVNIISESGLYTLILRCRDAVKKGSKPHAFRKWVTAEVLPAIRKHGRYEDASGKMGTLLDAAIGVTELTALNGVIRQKAAVVRKDRRRSFIHTMHSRLHTRFNVPRTELILAKDFEAACNFVAAYAIEGEWMPKEEARSVGIAEWSNIGCLIHCVEQTYAVFERYRLYHYLGGLGCQAGAEMLGFLWDGLGSAAHVKKYCATELASVSLGRAAA
ncbi:Bro-N domain-containing protein [Azotobacter vinelandii]|uniref:BRO-N domain-containing protein n=1 Tax=Azotobacter vinelandii TaxID=354 RepID=UPI00266572AD|nr:Bro-N domain-containing protein [Azotobacter vinelandii]WKN20799.1 Bro-N domain-containing protein [Azotobacter vinelandii]